MALASKVNIYPLAILLPGAFAFRISSGPHTETDLLGGIHPPQGDGHHRPTWSHRLLDTDLILSSSPAGLAAIISFRIFQPYAFDGLGQRNGSPTSRNSASRRKAMPTCPGTCSGRGVPICIHSKT
jgi:hypothetical protein